VLEALGRCVEEGDIEPPALPVAVELRDVIVTKTDEHPEEH